MGWQVISANARSKRRSEGAAGSILAKMQSREDQYIHTLRNSRLNVHTGQAEACKHGIAAASEVLDFLVDLTKKDPTQVR